MKTISKGILVFVMLLVAAGTGGCGIAGALQPSPTPTVTLTPAPTLTLTPTVRPSPTPRSPFYLEEFDQGMDDWDYLVASNEKNAGDKIDVYPESGGLYVKVDIRDTHLYLFNTQFEYDDVRMEFEAENMGRNSNSISMLCRYQPDLGWYVFVISNSGMVGIYRVEIKNNRLNYNSLLSGGSEYINQGKGTNAYAITCKGDALTLEINGHEWRTAHDDTYKSGQIGLSIMSFNVLPIEVLIKWVDISKPQ